MIRLYLIRHGQTPGNKLQRYIGTTDEPLSTEGKEFLEKLTYPMPEALYVSPLCRCVETAGILFPGKSFHIIEELSECDFGKFEYKNYLELSGDMEYQHFIDTMGAEGFPGGESTETFKARTVKAFRENLARLSLETEDPDKTLEMAVMEALAKERKSYYDWQVGNGEGIFGEIEAPDGRIGQVRFLRNNPVS